MPKNFSNKFNLKYLLTMSLVQQAEDLVVRARVLAGLKKALEGKEKELMVKVVAKVLAVIKRLKVKKRKLTVLSTLESYSVDMISTLLRIIWKQKNFRTVFPLYIK